MTCIGEMLFEEFGTRIERGVNLLLKNLIEVAGRIGRLHSQRHAAAVEEQSLTYEFEVGRNSSIRGSIEKLLHGDSADGVVILLKRTEAKARIDAFVPPGEETGFGAS